MPLPLAHISQQEYAESKSSIELLRAPRVLAFWHLASFDAPSVAMVWSLAFAWAGGIRLPGWTAPLLALGTWIVYVGDRLLDARAAMRSRRLDELHERHFFHWRHRKVLVPLAAVSACVVVVLCLTLMPVVSRERNSILAAAALMYFSGVHTPGAIPQWLRRILTKELLVGTIFTAGCAMPTLSRIALRSSPNLEITPFLFALGYFAVLAWLNCFFIDHWESGTDTSTGTACGALMAACGLLASILCAHSAPRTAGLVIAGAAACVLLVLLDSARNRIPPLMLRIAADLALLTPVALVLR